VGGGTEKEARHKKRNVVYNNLLANSLFLDEEEEMRQR
jgi:hypothetical protein